MKNNKSFTYTLIVVLIVVLGLVTSQMELPEKAVAVAADAKAYDERVTLPLEVMDPQPVCPSLVVGWDLAALNLCDDGNSPEESVKKVNLTRITSTVTVTPTPDPVVITTPVPSSTPNPSSTPDPASTPDPTSTPDKPEKPDKSEEGCKNKNSGKDGTPDECNAGKGQEKHDQEKHDEKDKNKNK